MMTLQVTKLYVINHLLFQCRFYVDIKEIHNMTHVLWLDETEQ